MSVLHLGPHRDPLRPPEAPGMGRGFAFAIVAHLLLVLALSFGVNWRTRTLPTFEAELWSSVPQAAAPREQAPPEPEPEVKPEPKPVAKPPAPQEDLQAQRDAEIAIAKARDQKKREDEAKRLADLEAQRKKQQELKEQKDKQDKLDKAARDKREAEDKKKLQEKQDRQDKLDKLKADKAADAKREQDRKANLQRMMGLAGASGGANATGSALQSKGPSATYGGRVVARVKPNIIFSYDGPTDLIAEVEVRVAPDGRIIGRRLTKPSVDSNWNEAVLRAVDKTEMLPRDTDGSVPSSLIIRFNALDLGH